MSEMILLVALFRLTKQAHSVREEARSDWKKPDLKFAYFKGQTQELFCLWQIEVMEAY